MGGVARPIAIALGSNLGDRRAHLSLAAEALGAFLTGFRLSSFIETQPVDAPGQPSYLNGAAIGWSAEPARSLLDRLQAIELAGGRTRPFRNAPRTLDLDLILCGDDVIAEPALTIPHPRFRERRFVLAPLAEIGPDLRDPVSALTVSQLLQRLDNGEESPSQRAGPPA